MLSGQVAQVPACTRHQQQGQCRPQRSHITRRAPRSAIAAAQQEQQNASNSTCRTCGIDLSKAPGGCDGEGRIIGGLAAVPGFGWWPIKAYRPCSGLSQAGIDYVRKGQATNEMLFGGVSLGQGEQQDSLDVMTKTAERGIEVDIKQ